MQTTANANCFMQSSILYRSKIWIVTRAGYGDELRFALRFSFSPCFASNLLFVRTRIRTHALRENFKPTILEIRCDWRRFACRSGTNLFCFVFFCLLLFYLGVAPLF